MESRGKHGKTMISYDIYIPYLSYVFICALKASKPTVSSRDAIQDLLLQQSGKHSKYYKIVYERL
jgi:hypothetical protein